MTQFPPFPNHFAALGERFFARTPPTPFAHPQPMHFSAGLAAEIGLSAELDRDPSYLDWFTGGRPLPGGDTITTVYAGHQFGHFVPQLGDGRAHLLGQLEHDGKLWELQLKGSGKTPWSRFGDGRAVWRSSIREYLCSEAMHGLGIPTTRALTLIGSDEPVQRETWERAAMMTRVAPSFLRFGHFEFFAHTENDIAAVRLLADFAMRHHFPDIAEGDHAAWFTEVTRRTARMIADWQAFGFAHGVMNTDNMSILGLTLDYGPFGFVERYDPGFICNHSDESGRYAFDMQPRIGLWNLHALAKALESLLSEEQIIAALEEYWPAFAERYLARMREKTGLTESEDGDGELLRDLLKLLEANRADYSQAFRFLGRWEGDRWARFIGDGAAEWMARYEARVERHGLPEEARRSVMQAANPIFTLRNHLAEKAIRRAEDHNDFSEIDRLFLLLQHPFDPNPEMEDYAAPAPFGADAPSISCSS